MVHVDFHKLCARTDSRWKRQMLDNLDVNCYVETGEDADGYVQSGTIKKVLRDQFGIPACVQITRNNAEGRYEYISTDRIVFWEPYDHINGETWDYVTSEEEEEFLRNAGYIPLEEECAWMDPKTGEIFSY